MSSARIGNYGEWLTATVPALVPSRSEATPPNCAVTLLGSFKNWAGIVATRRTLTSLGFTVVAPHGEAIIDGHDSFPILDADLAKIKIIEQASGLRLTSQERAAALERLFLFAIDASDFAYVVGYERSPQDRGGYYGVTVAGEIGYAWARNKPVFTDMPLSTTLDSQEGYTDWPYYAATVPVYTSGQLSNILATTNRLPETVWSSV